ncbi:MAG: FtsX-like permease family protein, partial [Candidatus Limnocylindrales bacterium]
VLGPPRQPGREADIGRRVSPRRLVFEGLVVILAVVGAIMLRDRGLPAANGAAVSGAAGVVEPTSVVSAGGPDPFLAAIPVLVGVAAALVALRLVPFPLTGLARLAARWPDLGPVLAVRRAARGSGASRVLLIILATTTLGAFASATIVDLSRTADLQAWQDVGAAYRIEPAADPLASIPPLPDAFDPSHLPGVTASATAFIGPVAFSSGGAQQLLVALDPAAYARVVAGTPAAIDWPAAMLAAPTGSGGGSSASPLPAIIASPSGSPFSIALGDTFLLVVGSRTVTARAVELLPRFPGIPADRPFIVLSRPQLTAVAPGSLRPSTTAFLRAPLDARPNLVAALKAAAPQTTLVAEAAEASALAGQPVVGVLSAGVVALAGLALLYAALAVVAAFILAASQRAAETAHLATLGLSDGQARRMLLAEYGPPVALAVLAGAGLGLGLFAFLQPGLGFAAIIGVVHTAPPSLDWAQVGLLVLLVGAILLVGVAVGGPAQRQAAGAAVRRGLT